MFSKRIALEAFAKRLRFSTKNAFLPERAAVSSAFRTGRKKDELHRSLDPLLHLGGQVVEDPGSEIATVSREDVDLRRQ